MIAELVDVLQREAGAAEAVEARLRALELVVAAGHHRFTAMASDDVETASERLASLELGRVLALTSAGVPADVTATQLLEVVTDSELRDRLERALEGLRDATARLYDARERARHAVSTAAGSSRARLDAAQALAGAGL